MLMCKFIHKEVRMPTNLAIDDKLLALAQKIGVKKLKKDTVNEALKELIRELRTEIIGPIRQELLSDVSDQKNFNSLKSKLKPFEDIVIETQDYELTANFYNIYRSNGVKGSYTDFLICSISYRYHMPIFTLDKDFQYYTKYVGINLHRVRKEFEL